MKILIKKIVRYSAASLASLLIFGSLLHLLTPMTSAEEGVIYGACGDETQSRGELTPPCCAQNNHATNDNAANLVVDHGVLVGGLVSLAQPLYSEAIKYQRDVSYKKSFQKTIVLRI